MEKGNGVQLAKQNITIEQYRARWLRKKQVKLGDNGINTIKMYESIFNNYFEMIDQLTPKEVDGNLLQDIINANCEKKGNAKKSP